MPVARKGAGKAGKGKGKSGKGKGFDPRKQKTRSSRAGLQVNKHIAYLYE